VQQVRAVSVDLLPDRCRARLSRENGELNLIALTVANGRRARACVRWDRQGGGEGRIVIWVRNSKLGSVLISCRQGQRY
jgi:hypothetical protein